MSTLYCASCAHGNPPKSRFCNYCGQELHVQRIDAHHLWHELQHGLLHIDKGILFTIKELAIRPGRMVREFLAGRRAAHFKPVSFLLLTVGAFAFLRHYAPVYRWHEAPHDPELYNSGHRIGAWLANHLSWMWLLVAPLGAWAIRRMFSRYASFNMYELLVLVFYLVGQMFVLLTLLLPLRFVIAPTAPSQVAWYYGICLAYLLWGVWQFYEQAVPAPFPRLARAAAGLSLAVLVFVALMVASLALVTLSKQR